MPDDDKLDIYFEDDDPSPGAASILQEEIHKLIDAYSSEFDLTIAEVIGVLEIVKQEVWSAATSED